MATAPNRKLSAILHADVVGYSRLMGADETATHRNLRQYLDAITGHVNNHQGRVVNYAGDAVLADFSTVTDALSCAVIIQAEVNASNQSLPQDRQIQFRIGVNLGEVIVDGDDIYGDGVNVAARLENLADPGGICISGTAYDAIGSKLPQLAYIYMGEQSVKNIAKPIRAYRVTTEDSEHALTTCPYPGMVPFSAAEAAYFYGRDEEISRMVQLLRRQRFLMVIGPSGSGKSSLIYAGLLPALAKSRYFHDGYWLIRTMRPGPQPTDALAKALGADDIPGKFDPNTVDTLLRNNPPAERLLILVDQFEEVFTQANKDERARFIAELQALRAPDNCALILTLRADFYPDLMNSYLWPVDSSQRIEVAPLRGKALRKAIAQPATDVGVRIEESLINQLLIDAADEPGVLPLLQETMGLLWEEMEQRTLSLNAYQQLSRQAGLDDNGALSGLAVAIAMKADSTLLELSPGQQAIARRIFLRLIQFGEGRADTRRQQPVSALRAATDQADELDHTLEHLTDSRLLTRSGGDEHHPPAVDISHESLINGWSRLQDWAEERREAEQIRRRLEGKAAEWVRLGKGTGALLSDVELPEAEYWLASADAAELGFDETLPEWVTASQQALEKAEQEREASRRRELAQAQALAAEQRQAATRMRRSMVGLAAVLLVAVAAGVFAWLQSQEADKRRIEAQQAEQKAQQLAQAEAAAREVSEIRRAEAENARLQSIAQLLLIQAPQQQESKQDEIGALLARQAYRFGASGNRALRTQIDSVLRQVTGKDHFSPILWPVVTPSVAFSPDGRWLASSHTSGEGVRLWNLDRNGSPPIVLPGWPGEVTDDRGLVRGYLYALTFSPNSKQLLAANARGGIALWDLDKPQSPFVKLPDILSGVWSVAYSADDRWLALGSKQDNAFAVMDLAKPESPAQLIRDPAPVAPGSGPPFDALGGVPVAFSPDSATLVSGSFNGTIRLWQPGNLSAPVTSLSGHQGWITDLLFYDDGKQLASSSDDGTIRLWNLSAPTEPPVVLTLGDYRPVSLSFDPGTRMLAAAMPGRDARLWQVDKPQVSPVTVRSGSSYDLSFSPKGDYLATAGTGSQYLRLFELGSSAAPRELTGEHQGTVLALAFSPDMSWLASGDNTTGKLHLWHWDDLSMPPEVLQSEHNHINSLDFSADGKQLLSASWNAENSVENALRLWDLNKPSPDSVALRPPLTEDAPQSWTALFTPDGRYAMWTTNSGVYARALANLSAEPSLVVPKKGWQTEIAFSPDGNVIAVANSEGGIQMKNLRNPDQPASVLLGHDGGAWSVAFSRDGKTLASGGREDFTVRLWNLDTPGVESIVLGRHDAGVIRVRFSPNGKQLASASQDGSVRLWNIEESDALPIVLRGKGSSEVWALAYSADGNTLVTGDHKIRIWDLTHPIYTATPQEVADSVCKKVWRNLTLEEWQQFIGAEIPYERTCKNLPIHPSLFETAEKLAKSGDKERAMALLEQALELDPELDLKPQEVVENWTKSVDE